MMTLEEIADAINQFPDAPMVVLTGGEPSLFVDDGFVDFIKQQEGECHTMTTGEESMRTFDFLDRVFFSRWGLLADIAVVGLLWLTSC